MITLASAAAVSMGGWLLSGRPAMPPPPVSADLQELPPLLASRLERTLQDARDHPRDADRRLLLARLYHAHGRRAAAARCYEQVVAHRPGDALAWHLLGIVRDKLAERDGAVAALERAAALAPDNAPSRWQLGLLALDAGRAHEAAARFEEALALDPRCGPARFGLARCLLVQGRDEEALALIEAHLLDGPHRTYAEHLRAVAYRQMGRLDEARPLLERGAPAPPAFADPWLDETLALRHAGAAVAGAGTGAGDGRRRGADELLERGQYAAALPLLAQLSAEAPRDIECLNKLAIARIETGDRRGGLETLVAAARLDPGDAATQANLARAHLELASGAPEAAAAALQAAERSLALRPESPRTQRMRGHALALLGRNAEAADAFRAAFRLDGRDPAPLLDAARLLIGLRRFADAAAALRSADEVRALEGEALLMLGLAELQSGAADRARAAVDRLRRRGGGVAPERIDALQAAIERGRAGGGAT